MRCMKIEIANYVRFSFNHNKIGMLFPFFGTYWYNVKICLRLNFWMNNARNRRKYQTMDITKNI
jgi:hypothetical protein